ncbi:MAG: sigma-54-dependent Fis family transcriptional regulator, partial [Caulobacteraceae bacterium]
DLGKQVAAGLFREDLFYRLNVFPIEAPSLRERREDIPALVDHFIARFNVEEGKRVAGLSGETIALLTAFDWPGNVRQLENAVYRAIVLADAPFLQPHDFPAISGISSPPMGEVDRRDSGETEGVHADAQVAHLSDIDLPPLPDTPIRILDDRGHLRTLEEIERDLIQHAIEVYAGHMSEIARRLGIGRSTLYRKVREQGLEGALKDTG